MTHVAEFTIPPEAFPFGETLVKHSDIEITVDQIIPTGESALPFFWVRGCEPKEFMDHAEKESEVKETKLLEKVGDIALFRAEWRPNASLIEGLAALDMTIIECAGTADSWRFEVRTDNHGTFQEFKEVFESQDIPIQLIRIYSLDQLVNDDHHTISSKQRDTLLTAYQRGYFQKPRNVTQKELAEEFGISRRAVAERLRRGTQNLIAETLLPSGGEE